MFLQRRWVRHSLRRAGRSLSLPYWVIMCSAKMETFWKAVSVLLLLRAQGQEKGPKEVLS